MKISKVGIRAGGLEKPAVKKNSGGEFSSSLDLAQRENTEKELKKMLEKIDELGGELKENPSLPKIREYKRRIGDYLSFVLKHCYRVSRDCGRYSARLLLRVEVINKKIEELTEEFIRHQQKTIGLVSKIDEIAGLLVDLYS
ncbi:MAG: YaaR family protein [Peptococcaceae bacterium]|nr:YaaR family protein [Peptococcaceae bacterium]